MTEMPSSEVAVRTRLWPGLWSRAVRAVAVPAAAGFGSAPAGLWGGPPALAGALAALGAVFGAMSLVWRWRARDRYQELWGKAAQRALEQSQTPDEILEVMETMAASHPEHLGPRLPYRAAEGGPTRRRRTSSGSPRRKARRQKPPTGR